MASKRSIKKQIRFVCGDLAAESITAKYLIPGADVDLFNKCVLRVAELQSRALAHVGISFDKEPRDFSSKAEYNKARNAYFKKAYASLVQTFNKEVEEILHSMNSAMPKPNNQ